MAMDTTPRRLGAVERAALEAARDAMVPPDLALPIVDVAGRLEEVFQDARPIPWRLIRLAAWTLELSPLPVRLSRFSRLTVQERARWLGRLESSRLSMVRTLFVVLKLLIQSVVYDDPRVLAAMGLDAVPGRSGVDGLACR